MKVGIMGGTFDPIHIGHLIAAERAGEEAGLDEIWFMPANVAPHKLHGPQADSRQRWDMVRLAVEDHPGFKAEDIELTMGGTSYSVDTVSLLKSRYPRIDFYYIIGGDMVMYLPKWHRIEELARMVTFIGLARPGYVIQLEELKVDLRKKIKLVPMPELEISSTDIRTRRRAKRSIRYLVTDKVREYIEGNGLYDV